LKSKSNLAIKDNKKKITRWRGEAKNLGIQANQMDICIRTYSSRIDCI